MALSMKIYPLTRENYRSWKTQMKGILMSHETWEFVIGEKTKPASGQEKIAMWVKKDRKAMADLLIALGKDEAAAYDNLETSKKIWDKIKATYESGGPARNAYLLKKLTLSKMTEGDDVRKHITEFIATVKRLREVELEIANEMLVILLLKSLPGSYTVFKTWIETQKELPSLDELRVKILEYQKGHAEINQNK